MGTLKYGIYSGKGYYKKSKDPHTSNWVETVKCPSCGLEFDDEGNGENQHKCEKCGYLYALSIDN